MNTLKERVEKLLVDGTLTPPTMRALLAAHANYNPLVHQADSARRALSLSDLDHMALLAFHAVLALEETQSAFLDYVQKTPAFPVLHGGNT